MKELRLRCLELAWDMKKSAVPTSIKDVYDLAEDIYQWTILTTERLVKWENVEGLTDKFEEEYQKSLEEDSIAENANRFQKKSARSEEKTRRTLINPEE